jgi:hypothetical protein
VAVVREGVRVEYDVRKSAWGYVWGGEGGKEQWADERGPAEWHAVLDSRPPCVRYAGRLRAGQKAAREGGKDVWDAKGPPPETPAEFAAKGAEGGKAADVPTLAG